MFESERPADSVWKDAEALVERVEQQAGTTDSPDRFFDDVVAGVRLTVKAAAVELRVVEYDQDTVLARSGVALLDGFLSELPQAEQHHHRATAHWLVSAEDDNGAGADRLLVWQRLDDAIVLTLDARFDRNIGLDQRRSMSELVEVVLELSTPVFLRSRVGDLRRRLHRQSQRDSLISRLHGGLGAAGNYESIAAAIASETQVDRVSVMRPRGQNYRLVSSSTQSAVDRRARQVRLLQHLVTNLLRQCDCYCFKLGATQIPESEVSIELQDYLRESGSRELYVETVKQDNTSIAAIILERFRVPDDAPKIETALDAIREPAQSAIQQAVIREQSSWGLIASAFAGTDRGKVALRLLVVALVAVIVMALIPAPLKIPAEGKVVAATLCHIYSPADGIVDKVFVSNGQHVAEGERLIAIRSRDLDLRERKLSGTLATAAARLDSILASRSRNRADNSRDRTQASTDEEVLRTEIKGLEQQLKLLRIQRTDLVIKSSTPGVVDHWDLQQSLAARPVVHGQHLLDIVSPADGWTVELELPDKHINYLLQQQSMEPCHVSFRLRSDPAIVHQGVVDRIAESTHLNAKGQSVVRVVVSFGSQAAANDLRSGATVIAKVHCGERAVGFVWFRGFVEWWRIHAWF